MRSITTNTKMNFLPDQFPEAANLPPIVRVAEAGVEGSSRARKLHSQVMQEATRGGLRLHRSKLGLGYTVLETVASPEQVKTWKDYTISIAITEPGAGSDPCQYQDHRYLRSRNERMGAQRREDFHLAGAIG